MAPGLNILISKYEPGAIQEALILMGDIPPLNQ